MRQTGKIELFYGYLIACKKRVKHERNNRLGYNWYVQAETEWILECMTLFIKVACQMCLSVSTNYQYISVGILYQWK